MRRLQLILFVLSFVACDSNESKPAAPPQPPIIHASNGKPMPEGYRTSLKLENGEPLELGYTQVGALSSETRMAIQLTAEDGRSPAKRLLTVHLDVGTPKPARAEDLAGRTLAPVRSGQLVVNFPKDEHRSTSASVSITKVTAEAIDGTITADLGNGWKLEAAPFHALRNPSLADESVATLARSTP